MARIRLVLPLLAVGLALFLTACDDEPVPRATAYRVETRDQLIGGPAATLDLGDFILANDKIRAGILGARSSSGMPQYSMGPGLYSGSLVDLDLNRPDTKYQNGHGLDQFAENYVTVNLKIPNTEDVEILRDGSDGGAAIIRTHGPTAAYFSLLELLDILCVPASNGQMFTDYILEPGKNYIKLSTTVMLDKADPPIGDTDIRPDYVTPGANVLPPLGVSTPVVDYYQKGGLIIGDFFMLGGNVDIFAPSIGFDEDGAVAENPNTLVEPFALDYIAAQGDRVSYGFVAPPGGKAITPLFSASMTATFAGALGEPFWEARTNYTLERYIVVGEGDVATIVDAMLEIHGSEFGRVEGHVYDELTGKAVSNIHVFVYHDPRPEGSTETLTADDLTREDIYSEFLTDRGTDTVTDGSFAGNLAPGRWVLMAKDGTRAPSVPVPITVSEGETTSVTVAAHSPANFSFSIRDQLGNLLPSKLTFREYTGEFKADPILGESFLSKGYAFVYFSPTGEERISIRPGKYQVMVSRGIEYSLYDTTTDPRFAGEEGEEGGFIVVPENGGKDSTVHLDVLLEREVDTTGLVSADLHVHATNSFDSGVPLDRRVLSMAAEGVEYMVSTDHDYITNYQPVIREMGLTPWINSTIGLEITTIELGHMLGFPMEYKADARSGGAVDWTHLTPSEMIEAMKDKGLYGPEDTVTVMAHPRDGILGFLDVYGYNPWTDVINPQSDVDFAIRDLADLNLYLELLRINPLFNHDNFTLDFDAIELLNAKRMDLLRSATYKEMQDMQYPTASWWDEQSQSYVVDDALWMYRIIERTAEEQELLDLGETEGGYGLNVDHRRGQLDDWFNMLNYGYRIPGVGNSDTHGMTSVEAGCPRNFIESSTDDPALVEPLEIAQAVKEGRSIATYGPIIDLVANGQYGIGSSLSVTDTGGQLELAISVQSASWIHLKRVEIYENGRMIQSLAIDPESTEVLKLQRTVVLEPEKDSWYAVVAMGDQDLSPVFQSVELPYMELDAIIEEALISLNNQNCAGLFGEPPAFPAKFPVFPFGFTNPIWVDVDGDADGDGKMWEPPGHADYMRLDSRDIIPPSGNTDRKIRVSFGPRLHR